MRLIDADRVTENLQSFVDWCRDGRRQGAEFCLDCVIPNTPTIGAVPLIRCRKCNRWNPIFDRNTSEFGFCHKGSQLETTRFDDYCSRAERKEE